MLIVVWVGIGVGSFGLMVWGVCWVVCWMEWEIEVVVGVGIVGVGIVWVGIVWVVGIRVGVVGIVWVVGIVEVGVVEGFFCFWR